MSSVQFEKSKAYEILYPDLQDLQGIKEEVFAHFRIFKSWLMEIPARKISHQYESSKWTVGEIIGHLIDTQLLMIHRIISVARDENITLPGADENTWTENSGHQILLKGDLIQGYEKISSFSQWAIENLPTGKQSHKGVVNGIELSVCDLYKYLIAHERHHMRVIDEKYLNA